MGLGDPVHHEPQDFTYRPKSKTKDPAKSFSVGFWSRYGTKHSQGKWHQEIMI